jgi:hypothetical protein
MALNRIGMRSITELSGDALQKIIESVLEMKIVSG